MRRTFQRFTRYITHGIWLTSTGHQRSRVRSFFIRHLKIILVAAHRFDQKHGRMQAASMTYYSVLAMVPWLTLIYGLMKGFGLESLLRDQLYRSLSSHRELIDAIYGMAQNYISQTQGTLLTAVGLAFLTWGVIKTLMTMEEAFNEIWGIRQRKSFGRRISDYLSIILICPFFVILSGSATVYVGTQAQNITSPLYMAGPFLPLVYAIAFFIPFIMIWMVFSFLYVFMPNTHVSPRSGMWGGFVAGALYQVTQWGYVLFQVHMTRTDAIYGSLAAIPLFLIWLHLSWTIVLFGAEIAFARQYFRTFADGPKRIQPSPYLRKLTGLLIMRACARRFINAQPPHTIEHLSDVLGIPEDLTRNVTDDLIQAGLLTPVHTGDGRTLAYQPGRTLDSIAIHHVLDVMEHRGDQNVPMRESPELTSTRLRLEGIALYIKETEGKTLIKDLAHGEHEYQDSVIPTGQ